MEFSASRLSAILSALPPPNRYWVAYSGGLDSSVLLHALSELRPELAVPVRAVHVDHGLSAASHTWAQHCAARCTALGMPCLVRRVNGRNRPGQSPEAAAREARYGAFREIVGEGDVLLTAHHQHDQAETLLLQLLRGAGPRGLAAMPDSAPLGTGRLVRPLLGFPREALRAYAEANGISWVDDPSNFDTGFDRNFLRHRLWPVMSGRWPALEQVLSRSAAHFAEAAQLLDVLGEEDVGTTRGGRPHTLSVSALQALQPARIGNALRYWIRRRGLPLPDSSRLRRIQEEVLGAREDAMPRVDWPGAEVRRYRDDVYAVPPMGEAPAAGHLPWNIDEELFLPCGLGTLACTPVEEGGLTADLCRQGTVTVAFRHGGERCRPVGRGHTHSLKKLFQEAGIPPWERERTPLVYVDGELAHVGGLWTCAPFAAGPGERGLMVEWRRRDIETW